MAFFDKLGDIAKNIGDKAGAVGLNCSACGKANTPGTKFCRESSAKLEVSDRRICVCGAEAAVASRWREGVFKL